MNAFQGNYRFRFFFPTKDCAASVDMVASSQESLATELVLFSCLFIPYSLEITVTERFLNKPNHSFHVALALSGFASFPPEVSRLVIHCLMQNVVTPEKGLQRSHLLGNTGAEKASGLGCSGNHGNHSPGQHCVCQVLWLPGPLRHTLFDTPTG